MTDSHPVLDRVELGRRVRAARIIAGVETASDLSDRLDELGVHMSERTIYAIERGESAPQVDGMLGLVVVLDPPGGYAFFAPAIRADLRDLWLRFATPSQPVVTAGLAAVVEEAVAKALAQTPRPVQVKVVPS